MFEIENKINSIEIQNLLAKVLKKYENIEFAFFFGSRAKNTTRFKSDIDVAAYFSKEPELLEIGKIVLDLEEALHLEVDFVLLNNLYMQNPELAYNIITEGVLTLSNNHKLLTSFKSSVFIEYLEIKPMLEIYHNRFLKRLHNNKFAERYDDR
ncbi:MAG: type VII toxin-antitoxin system MntA family adenylyltransferase antitoxin [Ignavibacteriaceae bacterium]